MVFFDLHCADILAQIFRLDYTFLVPDAVAEELKSLKVERWQQLGLKVEEQSGDQVSLVERLRQIYKEPSTRDLFALVLAHNFGCSLVTRDGELGKAARNEGVKVRHTLELIDELVPEGILSPPDAADALEEICRKRKKFPQGESWRRIAKWRS